MKKVWKIVDKTALTLTIVGGINWGFAIWNINIVKAMFGSIPIVEKIVYGAVGIAAILQIGKLFKK